MQAQRFAETLLPMEELHVAFGDGIRRGETREGIYNKETCVRILLPYIFAYKNVSTIGECLCLRVGFCTQTNVCVETA